MLQNGLENEVRCLIKSYNLTNNNQSMQGIGYKEWFDYFSNKISYEQLVYNIKINSRHYAKRQLTWFRAMPKVLEFDFKNVDKILDYVYNFLNGENMKKLVIAIDGPAGAGKTTIAKTLSNRLGVLYLNTGAIYRVFAYKCLLGCLDPENEEDAKYISENTHIDISYKNGEQIMYLDGNLLSINLHTDKISDYASKIAKHLVIREKCVEIQHNVAKNHSIIVDGRDIGSVVFPDANFKFYLDADVFVRAQRRYKELLKTENDVNFDDVLNDMKNRDYNDIHRQHNPLKVAENAIIIDSTNLSVDEVVSKMLNIIKEQG